MDPNMPMPTAQEMLMQLAVAEGFTNPTLEAGDICFRRCVTNFKSEPTLEMGEKACMTRCVRKFYEAFQCTVEKRAELMGRIKEDQYPSAARLVGDAEQAVLAAARGQ